MQPNVENYDGTKQGCHHLQSISTNRGRHNNRMVKSSLGTMSTLSFTNSSLAQGHPSLLESVRITGVSDPRGGVGE
jgi:hypothetical protein